MALTDSDTANYRGILYLYGKSRAPFLTAIGSKVKRVSSRKFAVASPWTLTAGSQDTQSENTAAAAGDPVTITPGQDTNVCQIMKKDVLVTFASQSNAGEFLGVNNEQQGEVLDQLGFQKKGQLMQMATDIEYSFLQGAFTDIGTSATNVKTRGLKNAISTNTVAAGGLKLTKNMIEEVVREMVASGAMFDNIAFLTGAYNMQKLSDIYGYAPQDRTVGGVAIEQFLVPGAGVVRSLYSPQMPEDEVYLVDLSVCAPVFMPVTFAQDGNVEPQSNMINGVDVLFQPIAITAAARGGFFYTCIGLDYGPEEYHGSITGLATSE